MPSQEAAIFTDRVSKKQTQETLARLRELGGARITEESGIGYHDGKQILLPEGMSLKTAAKYVNAQAISMEETHDFTKVFRYRPYDGAYALQQTLKEVFGLSGQGKAIHTMFGSEPPKYVNVEIGIGQEVRVPWGHIDFPPFEGIFMTGVSQDPQYGMLFQVTCRAPKKYEPEIEGLWIAVEDRLRNHSIYKGKAIVGVGRVTREGVEAPTFLNAYAIDPSSVAYSKDVFEALRANVWGPIRTAELQRRAGLKLNRKSLLFGTYGTGKSLAGGLTARSAVNNGWTFIQTKTGDEDLDKVMKTAELYAPAVVFVEDIDTLIESDPGEMAKMLEMFDGMSTKDKEVMVLMTSNHIDALTKGMTRVGRIDAATEIGDLDTEAIRRLISNAFEDREPYDGQVVVTDDRGQVSWTNGADHGVFEKMSKRLTQNDFQTRKGSLLADDVDFERVLESMEGYEPAFIMGTFNLAKSNAIIRTESMNFQLTTEDFVLAADTLRNQHDKHTNAADRPTVDTFALAMKRLLGETTAEQLQNHKVNLHNEGELITLEP
jgi:transitional endoplasmic reticulum ATPase